MRKLGLSSHTRKIIEALLQRSQGLDKGKMSKKTATLACSQGRTMSFAPKHILVPVAIDPSDDVNLAKDAVFTACDIAIKFSSKITLLHLATRQTPGGNAGIDMSGRIYQSFMMDLYTRLERGRRKITELQKAVKSRGICVEARIVDSFDRVPNVILDTAHTIKADLLVMGSHGRSGLSKMIFGSVAEKVLEKTTIPVLLLHPTKEKKA
jgi:nucleotide-binding universal stress UspA family protein